MKEKTLPEIEAWYLEESGDIERRIAKAIEIIRVQEGRRIQLEQHYKSERKRIFHF